jgi:hypothetical protein
MSSRAFRSRWRTRMGETPSGTCRFMAKRALYCDFVSSLRVIYRPSFLTSTPSAARSHMRTRPSIPHVVTTPRLGGNT